MANCLKLYVVLEHTNMKSSEDGKYWAETLATIDLGKCYPDIYNWNNARGYLIADDGNTEIETDKLGYPLGVAEIKDVIDALNEIIKCEDYGCSMAVIAKDMLKSFQKHFSTRNGPDYLSVYTYTY